MFWDVVMPAFTFMVEAAMPFALARRTALILAGHWALFAALIGRAVMGYNYSGYYTNLNFVTNTVTTLFGVWTGSFTLYTAGRVLLMMLAFFLLGGWTRRSLAVFTGGFKFLGDLGPAAEACATLRQLPNTSSE